VAFEVDLMIERAELARDDAENVRRLPVQRGAPGIEERRVVFFNEIDAQALRCDGELDLIPQCLERFLVQSLANVQHRLLESLAFRLLGEGGLRFRRVDGIASGQYASPARR